MNDKNINNGVHLEKIKKAAEEYLQRFRGPIIPVDANKNPLIDWKKEVHQLKQKGYLVKVLDELKPAGIAIATGSISESVVLEIAPDFDYSKLKIPETWRVKTGEGGMHFFFFRKSNSGQSGVRSISSFDLRPSINGEIKADHGLTVLPPSLDVNGKEFTWIEPLPEFVASVPRWILNEKDQRDFERRLKTRQEEKELIIKKLQECLGLIRNQ